MAKKASIGKSTEMEIGGKTLKSSVSSDLNWNTHVDKLCGTLKQGMSLLKRIKRKVNNHKMTIFADAIFQSKLRYGIAAYRYIVAQNLNSTTLNSKWTQMLQSCRWFKMI